jgi:hypothetical protein
MPKEEDVSSPKGLIIGSTILALAVAGAGYLFLSDTDKGAVQTQTVEPAATGQIPAVAPLPEAARLPPSQTSSAAEPSPRDLIRTATPAQAPVEDAAASSRAARPVDTAPEPEAPPERPPTAQSSSREPILTESAAQSAFPTLPPPQTRRPSDAVPQVAPPQASVPLQPTATVPQKPDVLFVQRSAVNIRSAPSRTSGVVGTAALGTRFEATNRENTWVKVESGPLKGWINGRLLTANEPQPPATVRVQKKGAIAPTVNIKATCQAAQKTITEIFGDDVAITFDGCMRQEQDAADSLAKNWGTYPAEDRQRCVNKTGYMPSYVEWLTCFEMARDVRQMRKDQPATPTSTTRNKAQRTSKKS